jgi:glycosyltransferase involved in cell wall biosynthesis
MAFAKPVISTDTHGAREVIENRKTGILVPIGKPDQMAESVINLLDQPEQMKKMGQKGFERLIRYFTCEQFIKKYEIFYRKVLLS